MVEELIEQLKTIANSAEPAGLLYHYTDQKGLLGILESRKVWATHARYLNDASELSVLADALLQKFSKAAHSFPERIFSDVRAFLKAFTSTSAFVTSFSEHGNLLSQWRAYSGTAGGYSIAFTYDHLREANMRRISQNAGSFLSEPHPLDRCIYYGDGRTPDLEPIIDELVVTFCKELTEIGEKLHEDMLENPDYPPAAVMKALVKFLYVISISVVAKHGGFREEAEWRMTFIHPPLSAPPGLLFRPGNSMLIPYIEVPLEWEGQPIGIKEIIIGPCSHPEESFWSVKLLLQSKGITDVDVHLSQIPYRN